MSTIINIAIIIFIAIIAAFLLFTLKHIIKIFKLKEHILEKELYTNLKDQLETINELLDLIDNQINVEIAHKLRSEYTLGERYNQLNMDKDCRDISLRVYSSINKSLFIHIEKTMPIYNSSFWMHYITKKTTCSMLAATRSLEK